MKKLVGITAFILFISITINAQQKNERQRKGAKFTPKQSATLATKRMTLALDLTKNQQAKVYQLMMKNATERQEKMVEMKKRKGSGVKLTSDEKFEMQKQRLDKMTAHKAAMKTILSKDQFKKWEKTAKSKIRKGKQKSQKKGMKKGKRKDHRGKK